MMKFFLPQLLVLMFVTVSVGQLPVTPARACPAISVDTPHAGILQPRDRARYTATVSGADGRRLRYSWSVRKGKIVAGQGTDSIEIVFLGYDGFEVTVKVTGLPTGCGNTASMGLHFAVDPGPRKLGEISGPNYKIDNRLLARIRKEARSPNSQLYLILQFEVATPEAFKQDIRKRVANQLRKTNIDEARITFAMAENGGKTVLFWLVPPGADNPTP